MHPKDALKLCNQQIDEERIRMLKAEIAAAETRDIKPRREPWQKSGKKRGKRPR